MTAALSLLAILALLGAFDTLYYHEWRARLPSMAVASRELILHAARDFIYAVLFSTLVLVRFEGYWVVFVLTLLFAEIVITFSDFVVEIRVRKALGGVYPGERITHALMGIVYGAMLSNLVPLLLVAARQSSSLAWKETSDVPAPISWTLLIMSLGVFVSGLRDLYAAVGLRYGHLPWQKVQVQDD